MNWTRRSFLNAAAVAAASAATNGAAIEPGARRKKIALIGTVIHKNSHAQHFVDRLALGYPWAGAWRPPAADLVSLYLAQFPENDLGRGRAKRYDIPIY